jgi:hypothetical protein
MKMVAARGGEQMLVVQGCGERKSRHGDGGSRERGAGRQSHAALDAELLLDILHTVKHILKRAPREKSF